MSTIHVNGREITVPDGSSVNIKNNRVFVNGLEWKDQDDDLQGVVRVEISGDVKNVHTDSSLHVHGDVQGSADVGGSMNCGNVTGHVKAGGSVKCGDVGGNVSAAGNVKSGNIGGVSGH